MLSSTLVFRQERDLSNDDSSYDSFPDLANSARDLEVLELDDIDRIISGEGTSSRNGRLRRRGEMNEHEIVAMIATILEFLKSNETP